MTRAATVVDDLVEAGFQVESVTDLFARRFNYMAAIPILLRWLPLAEEPALKEEITRALSVRWAKPTAWPALVEQFKQGKNEDGLGLRWTTANALSVVADDSAFEEIAALAMSPEFGRAREMLAICLENMKDPRVGPVLLGLLSDEQLVGHAAMALGKHRYPAARARLEALRDHPRAWVRRQVRKALAAF